MKFLVRLGYLKTSQFEFLFLKNKHKKNKIKTAVGLKTSSSNFQTPIGRIKYHSFVFVERGLSGLYDLKYVCWILVTWFLKTIKQGNLPLDLETEWNFSFPIVEIS